MRNEPNIQGLKAKIAKLADKEKTYKKTEELKISQKAMEMDIVNFKKSLMREKIIFWGKTMELIFYTRDSKKLSFVKET